jgi:hypothetical protein
LTKFPAWIHRPTTVLLYLAILTSGVVGQQGARSSRYVASTTVIERNIRAELGFLASDAMQGRGSGSSYERVAAEYIGSLFQQFGLEPAGDQLPANRTGVILL